MSSLPIAECLRCNAVRTRSSELQETKRQPSKSWQDHEAPCGPRWPRLDSNRKNVRVHQHERVRKGRRVMNVGRCQWGLLSVLAACLASPVIAAPTGDPILIGVMGGTTGAYGNIGTQAQQGALLAQDKLMSEGGVLRAPRGGRGRQRQWRWDLSRSAIPEIRQQRCGGDRRFA